MSPPPKAGDSDRDSVLVFDRGLEGAVVVEGPDREFDRECPPPP